MYCRGIVGGDKVPDGGGDGVPDKYQKKVTFQVVNGTWEDGTSAAKVTYVTLMKDGKWGMTETLRVEDAPAAVLKTAVDAARLIGNGLYGVDLKEINGIPHLIEINDNPSLDAGIEDEVLGMELYTAILKEFRNRIVNLRSRSNV